jgi:hypothetical protein
MKSMKFSQFYTVVSRCVDYLKTCVFSLVTFHINYSMYCAAELHVSAVEGHHQVRNTQVTAFSCKYTILTY